MAIPGGRIVVAALEDEGIPFTFGIPGTHNIELYDAVAESESVRPILVGDEQAASFMADGVWRASGRLGCASLVPGAGLTHAMSGIAEAWMDTVPMLVLGCGIRTDTGHGYQLHDIDQMAMVAPVTKARYRPMSGSELYEQIREACRVAREGAPGPVYVEVPANLYIHTHDVDLDALRTEADARVPARFDPDAHLVAEAVGMLDAAERPLLYLGLGALGVVDRVVALAERLEAPVATTFQGKGVFPESHPLWLWPGFGEAAPPFVRKLAAESDVVLAIGCRFGEVGTGSYGLDMPGPLIHVDIDADVLGRNYPAAVAIHGDAAATVDLLLDRLKPSPRRAALRRRIADGHAEVEKRWSDSPSKDRVTPHALVRALQTRLGPDTVYTADSGNGTFLGMELLRLDSPRRFLAPVDYSCMGYSVPAALGAGLAVPDQPVVALAGDGAFLMTGLELLTAASHEIPAAIFVLRDGELAQIAQIQDTAFNRRTASRVHDYRLEEICRGCGVEFLLLETDEGIPAALDEVVRITGDGRPVVVEVAIDYSTRTYFTKGIVKTNLKRLPWKDRIRFVGRALGRRITG